jgi:hypothetical protein
MDFITLVGQENNVEAQQELNNMLSQKVVDALNAKKIEVAASLFGAPTEQTTETE